MLFRSSDAARSWSRVAGTAMMLPELNFPPGHGLALAGWPAAQGVWGQLCQAGPYRPNLLVHTFDGGGTWGDGAPKVVEEITGSSGVRLDGNRH